MLPPGAASVPGLALFEMPEITGLPTSAATEPKTCAGVAVNAPRVARKVMVTPPTVAPGIHVA